MHSFARCRVSWLLALSALASLPALTAAQQPAPLVEVDGRVNGGELGAALVACGDVNADGVTDLALGEPGAGSGRVAIVSGLDGAAVRVLLAVADAPRFGAALVALGDVSGDGVPELAVAAPGASRAGGSGAVSVFDGADGTLRFKLEEDGSAGWTGFGTALAAPGPLTVGGGSDLVIGLPHPSGTAPGEVRAVSGDDGASRWSQPGAADGDAFGSALAVLADLDGDNIPELLVGAPGVAPDAPGYVRVLSGADGTQLLQIDGGGGRFGAAVAAAGDVNADGAADFAVGVPGLNRVDVYSGATGQLLRRFEQISGSFGAALANLGDHDGDGVDELLIGAPTRDTLGVVGSGAAFVLSGATGQSLFPVAGLQPGETLGAAVAAVPDVDGDGRSDFALGAPGLADGAGRASLLRGALVGTLSPYGQGCPDSFLITPRIEAFADPVPGGDVLLRVFSATGGAPGVIFLGLGTGEAPLATGCVLWVATPPLAIPVVLGGAGPGQGSVTLSGTLPAALPGATVFAFQAFTSDPIDPERYATTGAIRLESL